MDSKLIYGEKNMCASYFAGIDALVRVYAGWARLGLTATSVKDVCMDHRKIALSNAEVCQRFKCNKDTLEMFPRGTPKKIAPGVLDELCHDTKC